MVYNPYSDIQKVYNAKVNWNKATTDKERERQNKIATTARKNLEAYGYSDIANQISAEGADATAVRKILEQYAPTSATTSTIKKATTAPDSTSLSNSELITINNNETRNKVNQFWGTQTKDREVMAEKYNKLEDTAYSNPFETDEAKTILAKYDLEAMKGRDNEVASGGASNGGNIDSYAAANALRQQAALINKGQMVALDAHNNKINNVKGILADLGVYLQNQDKGMQTTIGLQANEGQRLFENEETAKNNESARLSEQASVTGYVPNEWTIKNDDTYNQFLNTDGTFKKEMENVDIQALINSAKANGDTETAKKLAVVRARKMLGNYGAFGQYLNQGDIAFMENQITEERRQSEQDDATVRESLKSESEIKEKELQNEINKINAEKDANKELLEFQANLSSGTSDSFSDDQIKQVDNVIKQINNQLKNHKSNPNGIDLVNYSVNGIYSFNPTPNANKATYWRDDIIPIIYNSGLTSEERTLLYNQLGFSYEDILDVYTKKGYLDDQK